MKHEKLNRGERNALAHLAVAGMSAESMRNLGVREATMRSLRDRGLVVFSGASASYVISKFGRDVLK